MIYEVNVPPMPVRPPSTVSLELNEQEAKLLGLAIGELEFKSVDSAGLDRTVLNRLFKDFNAVLAALPFE